MLILINFFHLAIIYSFQTPAITIRMVIVVYKMSLLVYIYMCVCVCVGVDIYKISVVRQ